jgi:hypothetical protein
MPRPLCRQPGSRVDAIIVLGAVPDGENNASPTGLVVAMHIAVLQQSQARITTKPTATTTAVSCSNQSPRSPHMLLTDAPQAAGEREPPTAVQAHRPGPGHSGQPPAERAFDVILPDL